MIGNRKSPVDPALIDRLAASPRYAQIPLSSLSPLVDLGVVCSLIPEERILEQGTPGSSIYIVLSGRLKMFRSLSKGRNALLSLFGFGDLFGIRSCGGRSSDATVAALEPSVCLDLPYPRLISTLEGRPQLLADFLTIVTEQVSECRNCVVEGVFFRVEARLARLFLRLGESVGRLHDQTLFIPVRLSRQDLADMAGTTIETTIRIMSRWGKEEVVETRRDGFLLRDQATLNRLCGD